jgi:hypothetical protein
MTSAAAGRPIPGIPFFVDVFDVLLLLSEARPLEVITFSCFYHHQCSAHFVADSKPDHLG